MEPLNSFNFVSKPRTLETPLKPLNHSVGFSISPRAVVLSSFLGKPQSSIKANPKGPNLIYWKPRSKFRGLRRGCGRGARRSGCPICSGAWGTPAPPWAACSAPRSSGATWGRRARAVSEAEAVLEMGFKGEPKGSNHASSKTGSRCCVV